MRRSCVPDRMSTSNLCFAVGQKRPSECVWSPSAPRRAKFTTQSGSHLRLGLKMGHAIFDEDSGTYRSPWPTSELPEQADMNLVTYLFSSIHEKPEFSGRKILIDADTDEFITYGELHEKVKRVASGLAELGVKKGDVLAILLNNTIYYPVIFLATTSLGAIATTMNPVSSKHEIATQIKVSGAQYAITDVKLVEKVRDCSLGLVLLGDVKGQKEELAGISFTPFSVVLATDSSKFPEVQVFQSDTAALIFSPSTSGLSKRVTLTHRNFIALQAAVCVFEENARDASNDKIPFEELTGLIPIPMFHIYGLCQVSGANLRWGSTNVIMERFDFVRMLQAIEKYKIKSFPAVLPIIVALAKQPVVQKFDLSSLVLIACGGASLPKSVVDTYHTRFPNIRFSQGYGMTETVSIVSVSDGPHGVEDAPQGSMGYLIPNVQAKIVDLSTGIFLPPHEEGELWLRGPQIMKGYFNDPEATAATIDTEGWLHTGDLAYFDEEGALFIVDRIKELIKYKAYQVAPAELEKVLLQHPGILDAVVVPVPDEESGQVPVACVVQNPNSSLTESDITSLVAAEVAPYKKIRGVIFLEAIPRGEAGRIQRKQLARRATEELHRKRY